MKKYKPILFIFLAFLFMACVCGGGQPTVTPTPPTSNNYYYEIILLGESNSGGLGLNTSATVDELASNRHVQILNNTSRVFEDLDVGTNNLIGHDGLTCCSTHGFEIQITNRIIANSSFYGDTVYLLKAGQGGTQAYHWSYYTPPSDSAANNLYVGKFFSRSRRVDSLLTGKTIRKIIFCSLGINDMIAGNVSNDTFKNIMIRNVNLWRIITRETTPVVFTKFGSANNLDRFNNSLDSIANSLGLTNVYTVSGSGASMGDAYHWNYFGLKTIADRLMDKLEEIW